MQLHDSALAEELVYRAWQRARSQRDHPGFKFTANGEACSYVLANTVGYHTVVVVEPELPAHRKNGTRLAVHFVDSPDMPAIRLRVSGDSIEVTGESDDDAGLCHAHIGEAMARLSNGFPTYQYDTPYGYVESGTVMTLAWLEVLTGFVPGSLYAVSFQYFLEGRELSGELARLQDGHEYMQRFWTLMAEGRVVDLRRRLARYPRPVWRADRDPQGPHVMFEGTDGLRPTIPSGARYSLYCASRAVAARNSLDLRRWFGSVRPVE
jgi:hypothetical protein